MRWGGRVQNGAGFMSGEEMEICNRHVNDMIRKCGSQIIVLKWEAKLLKDQNKTTDLLFVFQSHLNYCPLIVISKHV